MNEHLIPDRLRAIGLTFDLASRAAQVAADIDADATASGGASLLRVTEVQREGVALHDGTRSLPGRLLPAMRADLAVDGDAVAVGDWVLARCNAFHEWWVQARVPPLNQLTRRLHDGRDKVTRVVIVSNVDTALLVMGLDHDFNLRRLERYVALVRMAGVGAVVVLTKKDLSSQAAVQLAGVRRVLPTDMCAVAIDALGTEPATELAPWLRPGQTLVMLGSSGAGKSTLTNALISPDLQAVPVQRTGANRSGDNRGRHTTTARSLHLTAGGACIIDTPGLRTLRLDGEAEGLGAVFDDIARLAAQCRFRDCSHAAEPGCAVREGVGSERLLNYRKLLREAQRDTVTALERKAQVQQWKARGREARIRSLAKRG